MPSVSDLPPVEVFTLPDLPYGEGVALQREFASQIRAGVRPETLLLVQHRPVITLGRGFQAEHLLASRDALAKAGVEVAEADRGGDVTYHGPGQLVGYPLLDLAQRGRDVHLYLRSLERLLIEALAAFGLTGEVVPGLTGVWTRSRKIAAIGINVRRWVTSHGFSLNVASQEAGFAWIVPCGLHGREVTSLAREIGSEPPMEDVERAVVAAFEGVFCCRTVRRPGLPES